MIWEYTNELLKGTIHQVRAVMNQLGADGWECFAMTGSIAYFKRRDVRAEQMREALDKPSKVPGLTAREAAMVDTPNGRSRARA